MPNTKRIIVNSENWSYPVIIGSGTFPLLKNEIAKRNIHKNIFMIIDKNVKKHLYQKILDNFSKGFAKIVIYILKPGESSKSYTELNRIYKSLIDNEFGRDTLILAIGGGVTGDLAGYAASTYMRGVQLAHVPTTLLADVDSSIGGKTGINFNKKKNMIGTFYQPQFVLIDTNFLRTLPDEEIISGLGEVLKYAFITSKDFYSFTFDNYDKMFRKNKQVLERVIYESVLYKSSIVTHDERESGIRKVLNFGHTFAHAYESESDFTIKHGQAVVAGIISALFLSNLKGLLSNTRLNQFLSNLRSIRLPEAVNKFDSEKILALMKADKKNKKGKIKFVLIKNIGEIVIEVEANNYEIIKSISLAIKYLNNKPGRVNISI